MSKPVEKIVVRTSQFPRELLEKAYRDIQESKEKERKGA